MVKHSHIPGKMVEIVMHTADVALMYDDEYKKLVLRYAEDQDFYDRVFAETWFKLMTNDMGPATRCMGYQGRPALPFQNPPRQLARFDLVQAEINKLIDDRPQL